MNKEWILASDGSGYLPKQDPDKPGSYAAVIYPFPNGSINDSMGVHVTGSRIDTTNNQMEVVGCGYGLASWYKAMGHWGVPVEGHTIHVVLDAQYVYCAFNPHPTKPEQGYWMKNWKDAGWRTSSGKPVENQPLWFFINKRIAFLEASGVNIVWHWVPGHDASGDPRHRLNNRVDSMCTTLVSDLRSRRANGEEFTGKKDSYRIFTTGETPELMGLIRLQTPDLLLFHKYEDMFTCPTTRVKIITVNTVGVMGKGLAQEFAFRYPQGEAAYKLMCASGHFKNRRVNVWTADDGTIFLFAATKEHWRNPSQLSWVLDCAREIAVLWPSIPVTHSKGGVALPKMGCGNGGLDWGVVKPQVIDILRDVPVVLY